MSELSNLIPISYDNPERPTVSGRELHEFLQVGADYRHWFPRMCEYGFTEGEDFNPVKIDRVQNEGGRKVTRTVDDQASRCSGRSARMPMAAARATEIQTRTKETPYTPVNEAT